MRSHFIADTRTGEYLARVSPRTGTFQRVLCGSGSGEHTFHLRGRRNKVQWRALTRPWARSLVIEEDGVIIYAGVISKRPHQWRSGMVKLNHVDIREIFRRRFPFGSAGYWLVQNVTPGKLVITGKSQAAVVAKVFQMGLTGPYSTWPLPINVYNVDEAGPVTVTYPNYMLKSVFDIVEDIQNLHDGPDVDLAPRKVDGRLTWDLVVGTPAAPQITAGHAYFNMTVREPALIEMNFDEDATDQLTGILSLGGGSEEAQSIGGNGIGEAATIPAMDIVQTHKTEFSNDVLKSYSDAALVALTHPVIQISASLMSTPRRNLATMPVGTMVEMYFGDNDDWVPEPTLNMRVITYRGDMTRKVSFEMQPLVGAI
jgi:hypothetical protein